jgi:dTDP-glucose 4,6-dehydratase
MKKILISGVCGFIFSNFLTTLLKSRPDYSVVGIDSCDDPVNISNIIANTKKYKFYLADIRDSKVMDNIFAIERPDIIIHGAAKSFVDSSIEDPLPFLHTNVIGTQILVNAAIKYKVDRFFYISTDEVYGSLGINEKSWAEESTTIPSSPYSASKLSGEHIVRAAHRTYGLNYNISRCCNIFGENQQSRNLIPKIIKSIINNKQIMLHDRGEPIREWMYVQDKVSAILKILDCGLINETYNIGSGTEMRNIDIYYAISQLMGKTIDLNLDTKRLGQDFRYSVNCDKLKKLGWDTANSFNHDLIKSIKWYTENQDFYK